MKSFENEIFRDCNYLKWPTVLRMKDIQFRIINNIYIAAEILQKRCVLK